MTHQRIRNLRAGTNVEVRMSVRPHFVFATSLVVVLLAACSALPTGGKPSSSPATTAPTPPTATASPAPTTEPTSSASGAVASPVPPQTSQPVHVTSAAQAAALVFASDPKFGSVAPPDRGAVGS